MHLASSPNDIFCVDMKRLELIYYNPEFVLRLICICSDPILCVNKKYKTIILVFFRISAPKIMKKVFFYPFTCNDFMFHV